MMSILLIGKGSLLGQALIRAMPADADVTALGHGADLQALDFAKFDAVVNAAYDPRYMREAYGNGRDMDLDVARAAAKGGAHFIMLSTRKVYGLCPDFPIREDAACAPIDHYGMNKLRTEREIQALMPGRCTILRLSNVFGFEPGRRTFFGLALDRLQKEDAILLDVSPAVRRDFLPLALFAAILARVLEKRPLGTFNLGAGLATSLGEIAQWLIEGYGRGRLIAESDRNYDNFLLDRCKLDQAIGFSAPAPDIKKYCLEIGRQLADA